MTTGYNLAIVGTDSDTIVTQYAAVSALMTVSLAWGDDDLILMLLLILIMIMS